MRVKFCAFAYGCDLSVKYPHVPLMKREPRGGYRLLFNAVSGLELL